MMLQLVDDDGRVLESTDVDAELWASAHRNERDAWALVTDLHPVDGATTRGTNHA